MFHNSGMADPKYAAGAKTLVDAYRGERVLMVNDTNHFRLNENMGFVSAVAAQAKEKGITSVGLEMVSPGQQAMMDAYRSKEISRPDFIKYFEGITHSHLTTLDARRQFYGHVADIMDSGLKVHPLGSYVGVVKDAQSAELRNKQDELHVRRELDSNAFFKEHAAEIDKDPRAFLEKYVSYLDKHGSLSERQSNLLGSVKMNIKDLDDPENEFAKDKSYLRMLIAESFQAGHPATDEMVENGKKIVMGEISLEGRQSIDAANANRIAQILQQEPGNMLVFYGVQHSIHDKDIDSELRKKGISTMIVDAEQGEWACKPGSAKAMGFSYSCESIEADLREAEKAIQAHGDPNRYKMPDVVGKPEEITKRPEAKPAPAMTQ